jgi:hypothetical protein
VIADQYAMLRRVGFDGAEIPDEIAARQPAEQWQFRAADWQAHHYQARCAPDLPRNCDPAAGGRLPLPAPRSPMEGETMNETAADDAPPSRTCPTRRP